MAQESLSSERAHATANEQSAILHWLSRPDAYSHRPDQVEHIETHISHVFLAGPYAYKLKKPVRFDFLDFSTVGARELACRDELRLNRRLAPDVYLKVVPVVHTPSGTYQLDAIGHVVDWVVQMRRLPTELTLDALARAGQLTPNHMERLVTRLAHFYNSSPPLSLTPGEYRSRYQSHIRSNLQELLAVQHHLPRNVVERIHGFQLQLLNLRPALLEHRARAGHIVDGHGDLRPEHICFTDPIVIFDCIEFSPEFRCIDVADELAFLATECDYLGAEWAGQQLLRDYRDKSRDWPAPLLLDFYKSYRSCVRAKVAALRADQLSAPAQAAAVSEAARHLSLADGYVAPWLTPIILVVGGAAGTGKTTLAAALADALGAELLRSDVMRQELFGAGPHEAATDKGIYSPDARQRVYEELFHRAAGLNQQRISVVLDATFSTRAEFQNAHNLAADPRSIFFAVQCCCRPEIAAERITRRLAAGEDISDAHPELHDVQRQRWQPWPANVPQVRIDTEQPLSDQVQKAITSLANHATE